MISPAFFLENPKTPSTQLFRNLIFRRLGRVDHHSLDPALTRGGRLLEEAQRRRGDGKVRAVRQRDGHLTRKLCSRKRAPRHAPYAS